MNVSMNPFSFQRFVYMKITICLLVYVTKILFLLKFRIKMRPQKNINDSYICSWDKKTFLDENSKDLFLLNSWIPSYFPIFSYLCIWCSCLFSYESFSTASIFKSWLKFMFLQENDRIKFSLLSYPLPFSILG